MPRNLEAGNEYFNNPGVPGSNLLPPERRSIPPPQRARATPANGQEQGRATGGDA